MTNEQRRLALAKARLKALEYAEAADAPHRHPGGDQDSNVRLARMWADVAQAMKIGDNIQSDGVGPLPPDGEAYVDRPVTLTR